MRTSAPVHLHVHTHAHAHAHIERAGLQTCAHIRMCHVPRCVRSPICTCTHMFYVNTSKWKGKELKGGRSRGRAPAHTHAHTHTHTHLRMRHTHTNTHTNTHTHTHTCVCSMHTYTCVCGTHKCTHAHMHTFACAARMGAGEGDGVVGSAQLMAAVRDLMQAAGLPLNSDKEELLRTAASLREQLQSQQRAASEVRAHTRVCVCMSTGALPKQALCCSEFQWEKKWAWARVSVHMHTHTHTLTHTHTQAWTPLRAAALATGTGGAKCGPGPCIQRHVARTHARAHAHAHAHTRGHANMHVRANPVPVHACVHRRVPPWPLRRLSWSL